MNESKQEEGRLCLPDCLGGFQPEEGACLLAGDVAFGLSLPHHQGLQLQVMDRHQSGLSTQLTLLNTLTDCNKRSVDSGLRSSEPSAPSYAPAPVWLEHTAHAPEHIQRLQWTTL